MQNPPKPTSNTDGRKGFDRLWELIRRLEAARPGWAQLVLFGPACDHPEGWKSDMIPEEVRARVVMPGYLPEDKLPQGLGALDALLCTSRLEGGPYPVMEAMACGVPVLTTPVGVVPSLVEHGRTGYLLSQETPVEDALSILLSWDSRQEERDRIRAAARERVVAKLDWRNAASPDLYYSLYREAQLIASRRPFRQRLHAEYRSLYQLARRR